MEILSRVVEADPRVGYALVFGSVARGEHHAGSDLDVAVGASGGRRLSALDLGDIASRLEAAAGCRVDIVDMESASLALAYRVFRDGRVILERERSRLVARRARAVLEYLDFKPIEDQCARGVLADSAVVDRALLAARIAAIRDAVSRIRSALPPDAASFQADRTAREVVILNLFVALQDVLSLATHWLADEGSAVPQSYRDVFLLLRDKGFVSSDLAGRLAAAAGLRNLVAHQYAVVDWLRIHEIASLHLDDLLQFCDELARKAQA